MTTPPHRFFLALSLGFAVAPAAAQPNTAQPVSAPPVPAQPQPSREAPERLLEALSATDLPQDARSTASVELISLLGGPSADDAVRIVLLQDPPHPGRRPLLDAIASAGSRPPWLWSVVRSLNPRGDAEVEAALERAVASFAHREAALWILDRWIQTPGNEYSSGSSPERSPVRAGSRRARLGRLWTATTGHPPAAGPEAAAGIRRELERLDSRAFTAWVAEAQTARANAQSARADRLAAELAATARRLHLSLPPERRDEGLVSMLAHPEQAVRLEAFDLVERGIDSGGAPSAAILDALESLVSSRDAQTRALAAASLLRADPARASRAAQTRLASETDPTVLRPLLLAITRRPIAGVLPTTLRWIGDASPVGPEAIDAVWALIASGADATPDQRAGILDRARHPDLSARASSRRLLGVLGDPRDHALLRAALEDPSPSVRLDSAEALIHVPGAAAWIMDANTNDPGLFLTSARAVAGLRGNPGDIARLATLPAPDPLTRLEGVRLACAAAPPDRLTAALRAAAIPEVSEQLLSEIAADPERTLSSNARLLLARARLDLGRALEAIDTLAALPEEIDPGLDQSRDRIYALASILLGRFDAAESTGAHPSLWLDALERADPTVAPSILDRIRGMTTESWTETDRARLDDWAARHDTDSSEASTRQDHPTDD